jgi:hypothetical protein
MGFVARGNTLVTDPGVILQERGRWLPSFIRSYNPGVSATFYHNATTMRLTDRYLNFTPLSFQFQHGGVLSWNMVFTRQHLEEDFTPLGVAIAKGDYSYTRHKLSYNTDQSRRLSASLAANLGQYYNGSYHSVTAALRFAPAPYVFIAPSIERGRLDEVGVGRFAKDVTLYTVEGRLALNPRLQLSGIFQKSDITGATTWNTRFSWEFKPLSYCYIVFNNGRTGLVSDRQVITKITYLKQF